MSYQRLTETICAVTLTLFATSALAEPPIWESNFGQVIEGFAGQDDALAAGTLSFTFPFAGNGYTTVYASTNGTLQLGSLGNDGDIGFNHWKHLEEFLDNGAPSIAGCNFKFEVHHFLVSKEAFLRCAIAQPFSRPGVQSLGDAVTIGLGDVRLAGPLWKVLPEQAVEVFVATSFP